MDNEYVWTPGDHIYKGDNVTVVIHAGEGITKRQMEPAVRLYAEYKAANKKATAEATAVAS